jgi:hypothetical protein
VRTTFDGLVVELCETTITSRMLAIGRRRDTVLDEGMTKRCSLVMNSVMNRGGGSEMIITPLNQLRGNRYPIYM